MRLTISRALGSQDLSLGGPGSGNWGHAGREGKQGGSVSRGTAMSIKSGQDWQTRQAAKKQGANPPTVDPQVLARFKGYNEEDDALALDRYQEAVQKVKEFNAAGNLNRGQNNDIRRGDTVIFRDEDSYQEQEGAVENVAYSLGDVYNPVKATLTVKTPTGQTTLGPYAPDSWKWSVQKTVKASPEQKQALFQGKDAPFKRGKDGIYRSDNGLEVRFSKSGSSSTYGYITHTASGKLVYGLTSSPLKNQQVALDAARKIGQRINFNLSNADLTAVLQDVAVAKQVRDAIAESIGGVYK